jgi:hypothetical protein
MPTKKYYTENRERILKLCKDYSKTKKGKAVHKKAVKKFRENHPGISNIYSTAYRNKRRKFLRDYKLSSGCAFCGYNKCASALEFHHKGDRGFGVNVSSSKSIETIKKEMEKCIVLCANCHRELHDKERGNGNG